MDENMKVFWFGHSCFFLKGERGISLLLDPFHEESVGYGIPSIEADIVLVSHDHEDHNNVLAAGGKPRIIRGAGKHSALGLEFCGVPSYHDSDGGRKRGTNTIFCFSLDGIRICHLGDLGHLLSPPQIDAIGPVDLLFLPVGGIYTIDACKAGVIMGQLLPAVTIPMHFSTKALNFELESVDNFLEGRDFLGPLDYLELTRDCLTLNSEVVLLRIRTLMPKGR
jgi:L-ascorbate metabolism protein UlaG (beta-lactamase superfamily)